MGNSMEISQEKLEQELMNLLLSGDHPILSVLRQHTAASKVTSREFTGVGFFTNFEVLDTAPLVSPSDYAAGHVEIQLDNLPDGTGCVLFVRDVNWPFWSVIHIRILGLNKSASNCCQM